jgi:hypothetical protein
MASDEIKEAIVCYFGGSGVETRERDWKRVAKRRLPSGETLREFRHAETGRIVYTLGDDEDAAIVEKDVWIYGYATDDNEMTGGVLVAFEPRDRWRRQRCQYDQHQSQIIEELFGLGGLDEVCENSFVLLHDESKTELRARIEAAGFVRDVEYEAWISGDTSFAQPDPSPPEAPIDPPTPPMLAR